MQSIFSIEEKYPDYEPGKGDCVHEEADKLGKWWSAKPVMNVWSRVNDLLLFLKSSEMEVLIIYV